jgi:phytoene synthase
MDGNWENRLLEWAYEGLESNTDPEYAEPGEQALKRAYDHCEALIKTHSRTFHLASALLPADKRHAARALYAFCRTSDDLVDCAGGDLQRGLEDWRRRALIDLPGEEDPVALAWTHTRVSYGIPLGYAEQLIEGVARDLTTTRYATFDDVTEYCYGVAATVGLMVMYIIGFSGPEAIPYAVKLGVALQLTNILRDVGEDWRAGRLYLPQQELSAFNLTEEDINAGHVDHRWTDFMRFQIERNRRLYSEALPGIALLDTDGRFAISAAAELYRAILEDIEAHDSDVFGRRAYVSKWGKVRRLPGIWWRSKNPERPPVLEDID